MTLSLIIYERRQYGAAWTFGEFYHLMKDCVEGLAVLHADKMAHNDILSSNIYYSQTKNKYMIGYFEHASLSEQLRTSLQIYFRDSEEKIAKETEKEVQRKKQLNSL